MSWDKLPPELWAQIIILVGARYFQEDTRRLTVCQGWYFIAITVLFQDFYLDRSRLARLFDASPEHELQALQKLKTTHRLDLDIHGLWWPESNCSDGSIITCDNPTMVRSCCGFDVSKDAYPPTVEGFAACKNWQDKLAEQLERLGPALGSQAKVHHQTIRLCEKMPCPTTRWRMHYLRGRAVRPLLTSLQNLTLLELDLAMEGGGQVKKSQWDRTENPVPNDDHHCLVIGTLLHRLVRLRFRAAYLCPTILRDQAVNPRMKDCVFALVSEMHPSGGISLYSTLICGTFHDPWLQAEETYLREDLLQLAQTLVEPQALRIWSQPTFRQESKPNQWRLVFDAIRNEEHLRPTLQWDQDCPPKFHPKAEEW